jgi:nitrogen fixation protein FixH
MKWSSPAPAADVNARPRRPAGWWYPWIFVAAMAGVIAVNMVMVFVALDTFPGLETKGHYRKGLAYNENLSAAAAQDALGWQSAVAFAPAQADAEDAMPPGDVRQPGSRGGLLTVEMRDRNGHPLRRLNVRALLVRPTHEGVDRSAALAHVGNGRYEGRVTLPLHGQWDVRVLAASAEQRFQATHRLFVR